MVLGHSDFPPLPFKHGEGFGYIKAEMLRLPGIFDVYYPLIVSISPAICRALAERGERMHQL